MKLRRLTQEGMASFAAYLSTLKEEPTVEPPGYLLTDPAASEPITADIEVEAVSFPTRFDAAAYLNSKLATLDNVERDAGLWAWLTLFYFDQVCPKGKAGARKVGESARYIPQIEASRRFYRHMLGGPYVLYRAHVDNPGRLLALLSNPMDVATSETYRLFIENPSLIACRAVIDTATWLYYDSTRGKIKRGSGRKDTGGCRRLIEYLQQIDCTFDLPVLTKDRLISMLPTEFKQFMPQQLSLMS